MSESDDDRTSISVTDDVADERYNQKNRGDSYEDVIWRLAVAANALAEIESERESGDQEGIEG